MKSTSQRISASVLRRIRLLPILLGLLLLAACSPQAPATSPTTPSPSQTSAPPSSTPLPTETPMPSPTPTSPPSATPLPQVERLRDLPYLPDALPNQKLDLYLPAGDRASLPVVLMLHGGGADKASLAGLAGRFAKLGYAVAAANYRDTMNTPYPAAVEDAFCALGWLHANAEAYHLDKQHIFVLGHSAGGTLAAILGVVDDPALFQPACPSASAPGPAGIITFTGIFDYPVAARASRNLRTYIDNYLGGAWNINSAVWDQASPITWIDGQEPPFLLIHGATDGNIPAGQSEAFAAALQAAGVPVELLLIPHADHAKILRDETSLLAVAAFLEELLGH